MKNKIPNDSIFKKKGFYVALYSCLGVVMVMALAITFSNLTTKPDDAQVAKAPVEDSAEVEMEPTLNSDTSSYLAPSDQEPAQVNSTNSGGDDVAKKPSSPTEKPVTTAAPSKPPTADETSAKPSATPATPVASPGASIDENQKSEPTFNEFDGESALAWPVEGEIVMDYSDQHAIYDKTLNQYRTNDNVCISADLGEQVLASADGVVSNIGKTEEDGNYVVIDHGNGWVTTYSQLQDGVLVTEGDVVQAGQVIGGVASPSIYSVLLGNHVAFKVTKDSVSVDPNTLLQ